jgi:hypothetical protein
MAQKSKMFRVATEGATTDGRNIQRAWIEQMAKNFDPKKYGARVWLEHIRGLYPDSDFRAYGDITKLEAREVEDGKLGLFAEIAPLPDLVEMTTKNKQKIYASVEIAPKFADTNEAYMIGLGVTDSPASLGTDVLSFAAQNPKANPYSSRKAAPENLFSAAVEVTLEFEDEDDDAAGNVIATTLKTWRESFNKRFNRQTKNYSATSTELMGAIDDLGDIVETAVDQHGNSTKALIDLQKNFATLQVDHKALQAKFDTIDTTDAAKHSQRPAATGATAKAQRTDC